jgi:hypothetical protein
MSRYQLTEAQRRDWLARVQPRFGLSDLALAKEMDLEGAADRGGKDYHKTVAGYVGDFRRGDKRGFTYFFEAPDRLAALAGACHCTPDDLRADLRAVLRVDRVDEGVLWLPGFEDLGPVHFDDGFVFPPVFGPEGRLDADGVRTKLRKTSSLSVHGDPGSGVSTLIRWLVRQAGEDGWRPARWEGHLPRGRAIALLADPDDGLDALERGGGALLSVGDPDGPVGTGTTGAPLPEWLKAGDHRLIRARPGGLLLGPVDVPWVREFVARVSRRAGKRMKLSGLDDRALSAIVELRVGPEEAGLRLREHVEASSRPPLRRLEQAARRRLEARGEDDAGLAAFDAWFPDLALAALRDPALDPVALVDGTVLAEARRQFASTSRVPADTDLLRACLPHLTGEASLNALRGSGLLSEAGGRTSVRLLGMIASSVAERVRDDPAVLRRCLVERHAALLRAVANTSRGPVALVTGLERLDAPSLALALAALDADWLRGLPWTPRLAARMVAVAEVAGHGRAIRQALKKLDGVRKADAHAFVRGNPNIKAAQDRIIASSDSPLRVLLAETPLPPLDLLAASWRDVGRELGIDVPEPTPARVRLARALHLARPEDLVDPAVWDELPAELGYPPSWFEVARRNVVVARIVLDPRSRRVGPRATDSRKRGPEDFLVGAPVAAEIIPWLARTALAYVEELYGPHPELAWMLVSSQIKPLAPVLAGRDRTLTAALRQAAADWAVVALSEVEPRGAEAMGTTIAGLVPLLRAMPEQERASWLRTPGGRVGPLWREAVEAGVPTSDLLSLWQDTVGGRVSWPTPTEGDHAGDAIGYARSVLMPFVLANVDVGALRDAAVLPTRLGDLDADAFAALAATPNTRRWIWSNASGLGHDEPFWRLLEERTYAPWHFDVLEVLAQGGLLRLVLQGANATSDDGTRERRKGDQAGIGAALAGLPSAGLPMLRWELLVRSALLAAVPVDALWHAVSAPVLSDVPACYPADKPGGWGPRKTVAMLIQVLQHADAARIRGWLVTSADALDTRAFVDVWKGAGLTAQELNRLLAARTGARVGEALVPALLREDASAIGRLLDDARTRDATLHAVVTDPELRARLSGALAAAGAPLEVDTLKRLLRSGDIEAFALLDEAAAGWPPETRRVLWQRVAGCASDDDRLRAWTRLAALGA